MDKSRVQQEMDVATRRLGLSGYVLIYPEGESVEIVAHLPMQTLTPMIAPIIQRIISAQGIAKLFGGGVGK